MKMADLEQQLHHLKLPVVTRTSEDESIGVGSYASVHEVMVHGTVCAAKEMHPVLVNETNKRAFLSECVRCSRILHPNVVQFLGIYYPSPRARLPWLVMELMYISLRGLIEKYEKDDFPFHFKLSILMDTCNGLEFLHSQNIIHRDLSSNNILLTKHLVAKIADLGMAKVIPAGLQKHTQAPGTVVFMPPEALSVNPQYGKPIDVFSVGCVCVHVISMEWPIPLDRVGTNKVVLSEVQRREQYFTKLVKYPLLEQLVKWCLQGEPEQRPVIEEVIKGLRNISHDSPSHKDDNIIDLFTSALKCSVQDEQITQQVQQLISKDKQLVVRDEQLSKKDQQLAQKDQQLLQKDQQLVQAHQQLAQKDQQLIEKDQQLNQKDQIIDQVRLEKLPQDVTSRSDTKAQKKFKTISELQTRVFREDARIAIIELSKGHWRFISQHLKQQWDKITEKLSSSQYEDVMAQFPLYADDNPVILLEGEQLLISALQEEINALISSVCTNDPPMLINRPGLFQFLNTKQAKFTIKGIEASIPAYIEITIKALQEADEVNDENIRTTNEVLIGTTKEGKRVILIKGEIENLKVDVIVNAANSQLSHGSGVALALSKKGGPKIQKDSANYIRTHGIVLDGDAVMREEVGNLPCKRMIYAVGPVWHGGTHYEDRVLKKACIKSLRLAQHYESISFPAISSGLFKFPLHVCADTMIHAFCAWSEKFPNVVLRDMYVVVHDHAVQPFSDAMKKHLTVFSQDHLPTASVVSAPVSPALSNVKEKKRRKGNTSTSDDAVTVSTVTASIATRQTAHSQPNIFYSYFSNAVAHLTGGGKSDGRSGYDKLERPKVVDRPYTPPLSHADHLTTSPLSISISSPQSSQVLIKVFAKDEKAVREAEDQLLEIIDQRCEALPVDDPRVVNLRPDQISQLAQKAEEHNVDIEVDTDLYRIQLRGGKNDVQIIKSLIERMLHELDTEKLKTEADATAAGLTQKKIKWQYQIDDEQFEDYDPQTNYQIETAYQFYKANVHGPVFTFRDGNVNYEIIFNRHPMQEKDSSGFLTDIQRIDIEDKIRDVLKKVEFPLTWDKYNDNPQTKIVSLHPMDKEYIDVKKGFETTIGGRRRIVKMERIQNPTLHAQYAARKKLMDQTNPPNTVNERRLYHGCDGDAVQHIIHHGFNRSYAGKYATAYGAGVYFAVNASYSSSNTYSPLDDNGNKHIFLALVLTGEYTVGNSSLRIPPAEDPKKSNVILFDSVVNNQSNPNVFVIFYDAQCYPEYLITFK